MIDVRRIDKLGKKKCKHNGVKRKFILQGKYEGEYYGYCSQQCKKMINFTITKQDVNNVYPRGRPTS